MPTKDKVEKIGVHVVETQQAMEKEKAVSREYYEPDIGLEAYVTAVDESFVLGGVAEKVGAGGSTYWDFLGKDPSKYNDKEKAVWKFLHTLDLEMIFQSLFSAGNAFVEVIPNKLSDKKNPLMRCDFMLPGITRVGPPKDEGGAKDKTDGSPVGYYQLETLQNPKYIPYKNVMHFKATSLSSKLYGRSRIHKCLKQVLLLNNIDKYYDKLFGRGRMRASILMDKQNKLTQKQKDMISGLLTDGMGGLENAFSNLIVGTELEVLNLEDDTSTEAFLVYRDKLIQAIAIATNIPYDLLISVDSNRASSQTALDMFHLNVVIPLQSRFVEQLKRYMIELGFDENIVDMVSLHSADTGDALVEMQVIKGYKESGIITANEARRFSPYEVDEREDGDGLKASNSNPANLNESIEVKKIHESVAKMYSNLSKK